MENRNIYKIDDILLILSLILLVPAVFFAWPWLRDLPGQDDLAGYLQAAPDILGPRILYVLAYLTGAVLSQISGRILRNQENLSLKILDEIGYSRKVRISHISTQLGMSDSKVESLVRKMSRVSSLNIGIEGDRIIRTRKSEKRSAPVPEKPGPDRTGQDNSPFAAGLDSLNEQIRTAQSSAARNRSDQTAAEQNVQGSAEPEQDIKFNIQSAAGGSKGEQKPFGCLGIAVLLILFMTPLWPIPLIFLIRKAVKQRGASAADDGQ